MHKSSKIAIKMHQHEFKLSTKKKKMKPKEIKLAKVGLYIVLIFVLCHSVRWVPNFYELTHPGADEPYWVTIFMHLSHFVLVFNSSVNFYVYCLTHLDIVKNIKRCFSKKTNDSCIYIPCHNSGIIISSNYMITLGNCFNR